MHLLIERGDFMARDYQIDLYIKRPVLQVFNELSKMFMIAEFKVEYVNPERYQIYLSGNMSLKSFGEDIIISFYDPMDEGARIIIYSKCKMPTALFDYGKNRQNVERIAKYITSLYR